MASVLFKILIAYVTTGILASGPIILTYAFSMPVASGTDAEKEASKTLHNRLIIAGVVMTVLFPLIYFAIQMATNSIPRF